jgi:hypothetical protein
MNRQLVTIGVVLVALVVIAGVALLILVGGALAFFVPVSRETSAPGEAVIVAAEPVEVRSEVEPPAEVGSGGQTEAQLSFQAATYRDEEAGFAFDYPAEWTFEDMGEGSRGRVVQYAPPQGTSMSVSVLRWDPVGDLDAFVEVRQQAWSSSGTDVVSHEAFILEGGREAVAFVVQTVVDEQAFFMFTTAGDRYLALAGEGDIELLKEIALTVRPI